MTDESVFLGEVVVFLNRWSRRRGLDVDVRPDTHLFETRILDSVGFLELMTYLQVDLGVVVPDKMLSVEFFQTPRMLTANFASLTA
jgi:acyl carrier protein